MAPLCYAAKFDPFLSLDCSPTPSALHPPQSKERKGSNFAIWQPLSEIWPISLTLLQHTIADEYRGEYNLSTNVHRKTDYDRLTLSLTSPLPNEQDFGLIVCKLLSNEGNRTIKFAKCPRLLDLLLSHAGVYNHGELLSRSYTVCHQAVSQVL